MVVTRTLMMIREFRSLAQEKKGKTAKGASPATTTPASPIASATAAGAEKAK